MSEIESHFDESDIRDIASTIDALFRYTDIDNGEYLIEYNRYNLNMGVMIYWGHGITAKIPNFDSLLLKEIEKYLFIDTLEVLCKNNRTTLFYNDCEIDMKYTSNYSGEESFFDFTIVACPNDTPCVSDDEGDDD